MNGKASGGEKLAGLWQKIARGRSLSEIPEGEMNFYLATGMTLAHAGVVFFFDLYFRSPLPDRSALSRHAPLLIQAGYGLLVPYLFLLVLCRLQLSRGWKPRAVTLFLFAHIGLTHAFLIWIFGAFSTAFVLFFPADLAMVYLLYRDGRLGRFVWMTGTFVVFIPAALGLLGILPYAPIYEGTPYEIRLSSEGFWIGCFVLVAISGQILLVMGQVKRAQERMADSARQLAASADHLTRLQSEATLGREVSKVAHELRTPLSAVRSILESSIEDLKRSGGKMTPEEIEDLAVALREQSRSLELVAALRNIARSVREEKVDLNRAVGDSLRVLKALETPGRMVVEAALHPEPLYFQGSHAEMMQVILNLARNAIDASPAGARVRLSTSRDGDGKILLRCEDEGLGIPAEIREKIFEPLFTTKEVGKGTGLGLSTSRDLVTRRGGALVLESSAPGKGSTFRVELPGVN